MSLLRLPISIDDLLQELEFTEGRATGIPKILHSMSENGSPPPQFEFDANYSYFMVRLPIHPAVLEVAGTGDEELAGEAPPEVKAQDGTKLGLSWDQVADGVGTKSAPSRHQVEIMRKCLEDQPLVDLMDVAGRSDRTKFRHQVLKPLMDDGIIEMTIPDKPRSSKQKYRLTEVGRRVLKSLETE